VIFLFPEGELPMNEDSLAKLAGLDESFIETNGIRLHAVSAGPQEGDVVILLHGFPDFWRGWINQIVPLAQAGFRVVVPDQRGYNLSDKPKGVRAYDLDALAGDVLGIIRSTGRSKAHLVGHNWGAAVAWHTAIQYPEMIDKLVILNVPHPDIMQQTLMGSFSQLRKSWYMFYFQIPWLPETSISWNNFANGVSALQYSGKATTFSDVDIAAYRAAWSQPGAMTGMINWYRAVFRRSLGSGLNAQRLQPRPVPVPTLVLWGKDDIALSLEMAQPSLELCAEGKLVIFDDASHWVQRDCAAQVNQEIITFLRGA